MNADIYAFNIQERAPCVTWYAQMQSIKIGKRTVNLMEKRYLHASPTMDGWKRKKI